MNREATEWCEMRWFHADDDSLPRVFMIGDSIVMGYSTKVQDKLNGFANVSRLATSKCIGDKSLLKELEYALGEYQYEVVHFNNGLHGWSFTEAEYEEQFPIFFDHIKRLAKDAKLIWATTTPVRCRDNKERLDIERNSRVLSRNEIAKKFLSAHEIATNDLYGLMVTHPELCSDGVHYNDAGNTIMADAVYKHILKHLA